MVTIRTRTRLLHRILSGAVTSGAVSPVVPATRTVRGIQTEVVLSEEDGMPEQCALSFDNVTTLQKALLTDRICRLGTVRLAEVCRALLVATA